MRLTPHKQPNERGQSPFLTVVAFFGHFAGFGFLGAQKTAFSEVHRWRDSTPGDPQVAEFSSRKAWVPFAVAEEAGRSRGVIGAGCLVFSRRSGRTLCQAAFLLLMSLDSRGWFSTPLIFCSTLPLCNSPDLTPHAFTSIEFWNSMTALQA